MQVFVESHLRVASIFAHRWSTHETRDFSRKRFDEFVGVLVGKLPGFHAVALVPPDLGPAWVVPAGSGMENALRTAENRRLLKESFQKRVALLSLPFELSPGVISFVAVLPLMRQEELLGYLAVQFKAATLLNDCFHTRIRSEFHFKVQDGERVFFRSAPAAHSVDFRSGVAHSSIDLPVRNRRWRLSMVPKKERTASIGWTANLSVPFLGLLFSVGLSLLVFLLFQRMEMYRAARDQHAKLSGKVLMAQEEERARLSRDLHDELGQLLTAMRLEMGWLGKKLGTAAGQEKGLFNNTVELVENATGELRRICRGLRPPLLDDLGLEPAMRLLAEEFEERTGILVGLDIRLDEQGVKVPHEVALCSYRILQEALTNISRHARAKRVDVTIGSEAGTLELEVRDDGVGFELDDLEDMRGWGIEGMRERANLVGGTVRIRAGRNRGTRVVFRVQLTGETKEGNR